MEGGWLPLAFGFTIWWLMSTWKTGNMLVNKKLAEMTEPVDAFLGRLVQDHVPRVPGTAIFLTKTKTATPPLLLLHVRTSKALQEKVICITVETSHVPRIPAGERMTMEVLAPNFWRCSARYGFMQIPNIPVLLRQCQALGCTGIDLDNATYYVGHETILPAANGRGMSLWRESIFKLMTRNAGQMSDFFKLPRDQVMEIGRQIEI